MGSKLLSASAIGLLMISTSALATEVGKPPPGFPPRPRHAVASPAPKAQTPPRLSKATQRRWLAIPAEKGASVTSVRISKQAVHVMDQLGLRGPYETYERDGERLVRFPNNVTVFFTGRKITNITARWGALPLPVVDAAVKAAQRLGHAAPGWPSEPEVHGTTVSYTFPRIGVTIQNDDSRGYLRAFQTL
jgi:hypothetical protein